MNAQSKHDALQEVADYKSTLHVGTPQVINQE